MTCDPYLALNRSRRSCLARAGTWGLALALTPGLSLAAASEAVLGDALRGALGERWRAATEDSPLSDQAQAWASDTQAKLVRWMPQEAHRAELIRYVWYEARRAGLSLSLVLGLIQVESAFRKYAISWAGAMGYMQIMPFWVRTIGDGELGALLRTQANLRYGCVILRHCLNIEAGDLTLALGRYNGSRGQSEYPQRVLQARQSWRHRLD